MSMMVMMPQDLETVEQEVAEPPQIEDGEVNLAGPVELTNHH